MPKFRLLVENWNCQELPLTNFIGWWHSGLNTAQMPKTARLARIVSSRELPLTNFIGWWHSPESQLKESGKLTDKRKNIIHNMMTDMKNFLLPLLFLVLSCTPSPKERAELAAKNEGDILIGIVDTKKDSFFVEGVKLAIKEVNEEGGIIGRRIKALFRDDNLSLGTARKIAEELSGHENLVAVIGHRYSGIAIPVSITYDKNGILFMSPGASNPDFIQYGGDLTFRNIPSDEETGLHMAKLAKRREFKNMVIFYQRDTSGRRLAEIFHEKAASAGIAILSTKSFFEWQDDFRLILSELTKEYEFDAILLAGLVGTSAKFIRQARAMGMTVPIIGGYALDSPKLFTAADQSTEGVIVPTIFDPNLPAVATLEFVKRFQTEYGAMPDMWAAQGYDAVRVLAYAMRETNSPVPIIVASAIRILQDWQGVTGSYAFTFDGDISGKKIFFKEFRRGKFEFMERDHDEKINPFYVVTDITLRLPLEGIITSIDPGLSEDVITSEVTEQLFMGLTSFDPETYEAVPALATDWEVSGDGQTYTFRMRSDVKWTNGESVSADDIVWAVRRNISPETGAPQAFMLYILKNAKAINSGKISDLSEIGVRAVDSITVEFRLESPAPYFPALAGQGVYRPLPIETVRKHGKQWTEPKNIVTNGPYTVAMWEKGMVMILRKNPTYCNAGNVSIPEVRYYIVPESSVGMAMYENNELDIMGSSYLRLPLMAIRKIRESPVLSREYRSKPQFCTYAYGFNTKRPPVDNPLVRKAISAAINRSLLVDLITQGNEEIASTFTRPPVFGAVDPGAGVGISFNPKQAADWLREAGYPGGKGFPILTLLYNASETHSKIAQAVQASLKHYLNIVIELEGTQVEDFYGRLGDPPSLPHMFRNGWCCDYPDANNWLYELFHPFNSYNVINWDNAEFAHLTDRALKSPDPEERKKLYRRAEKILCEEEVGVVPLYFEVAHCLVKSRVNGWYHMAVGGQGIRNWSLKK